MVELKNLWIEVKTKGNTCKEVAKKIRNLAFIKFADALFGDVDVMVFARIHPDDYLEEAEELIGKIKSIEGVITTITRLTK